MEPGFPGTNVGEGCFVEDVGRLFKDMIFKSYAVTVSFRIIGFDANLIRQNDSSYTLLYYSQTLI